MEQELYPNYRGTYIQVDLDAIGYNTRLLKKETAKDRLLLAVVKANAYGHGLVQVAKKVLANGADYLGVAIPEEGVMLRNAGIDAPILVMGGVNEKGAAASVQHQLVQTVFDPERVFQMEKAAREQGKDAYVHLKIDTGMGRIGVRTIAEVQYMMEAIKACPHVKLAGVFTHFADADSASKEYTKEQKKKFEKLIQLLPGGIIRHAAASAAAARYPETRYDMVRQGIALYGCEAGEGSLPVKPALSWHTEIVYIKSVLPGSCISYGCTFTAEKEMMVATLPVGYGDGYSRALSGKAEVLIAGKRCKVLGRVCMDQIMVDITGLTKEEAYIGAPVVLLGAQGNERITADEMAAWADTISYEMLMSATARVPVIYAPEKP